MLFQQSPPGLKQAASYFFDVSRKKSRQP